MTDIEVQLTQAAEELRQKSENLLPVPVPSPRPIWRQLSFVLALAALLAMFAIPVWVMNGGDNPVADPGDPRRSPSVYMVTDYVPAGLELAFAIVVDSNFRTTIDPEDAAGTVVQYLPVGESTFSEDNPAITIEVTDRLAVSAHILGRDHLECYDNGGIALDAEGCRVALAESACTGEVAIAAGRLDPAACIAEALERPLDTFGENAEVSVRETTIRGLPALIETIETITTPTTAVVSVTTYEGGAITTVVTGNLVDQEEVIATAEGLKEISWTEFEALRTDG